MTESANALPLVLVSLMRGIFQRESNETTWQALLDLQPSVRDYVSQIGLDLIVDESEGYAFLRQRDVLDSETALPRLVVRRPLSYPVSLILALLRKKLAEVDASSGETRVVLGRDEIVEMLRVFFADTGNEAHLVDRIEGHLQKIVELGFLQRLRGREDQYEVKRVLKAFVDAQWLSDFADRLAEYRRYGDDAAEERDGGT